MKYNTTCTEIMCSNCGSITPIQRKSTKLKKLYHLKELYCYYCGTTVNQIEVRNSDILLAKLQFAPTLSAEEQEVLKCLTLANKKKSE